MAPARIAARAWSAVLPLALGAGLLVGGVAAAESPVGHWKTVDDKTGKVRSVVEIFEQGGKVFGKVASLAEPNDPQGRPKVCTKCTDVDRDKPLVGLLIIRNLVADGDRYKGGTILDPEEGKIYKAEVWVEDGSLKVRGYIGIFFRTQTWVRAK